jgi:hypothetical protein
VRFDALRWAVVLLSAGFILGFAWMSRVRRRRKDEVPELNKHPERLEQMLDKTDDA